MAVTTLGPGPSWLPALPLALQIAFGFIQGPPCLVPLRPTTLPVRHTIHQRFLPPLAMVAGWSQELVSLAVGTTVGEACCVYILLVWLPGSIGSERRLD